MSHNRVPPCLLFAPVFHLGSPGRGGLRRRRGGNAHPSGVRLRFGPQPPFSGQEARGGRARRPNPLPPAAKLRGGHRAPAQTLANPPPQTGRVGRPPNVPQEPCCCGIEARGRRASPLSWWKNISASKCVHAQPLGTAPPAIALRASRVRAFSAFGAFSAPKRSRSTRSAISGGGLRQFGEATRNLPVRL